MSDARTDNAVFAAALDLQAVCQEHGFPFCFIGGIAVERWAVPRFTEDADMTLLTRFEHDEAWAKVLLSRFEARRPDALVFAERTRVLLLRHENGVEMDVALGALDFEERAIQRGSHWEARDGSRLFTCSADDLIVHKAFASRDKDWLDVESIVKIQEQHLNIPQIRAELAPLTELKEDSAIIPRLDRLFGKYGLQ